MVSTNETLELEVMSSNKKVQRMKDRQDRKVRLRNYGK